MKFYRALVITVSICDMGYQYDLHGYDKIPGKSPEMEALLSLIISESFQLRSGQQCDRMELGEQGYLLA